MEDLVFYVGSELQIIKKNDKFVSRWVINPNFDDFSYSYEDINIEELIGNKVNILNLLETMEMKISNPIKGVYLTQLEVLKKQNTYNKKRDSKLINYGRGSSVEEALGDLEAKLSLDMNIELREDLNQGMFLERRLR